MKPYFIVLVIALILSPVISSAWGCEGHKIVDKVALNYLNKSILDSIQYYLGDTKYADAGCWMDEVRSNHDFDYMKPWHYINLERERKYDPASTNNIVSALDSAIAHLQHRNRYTKEQIATDIKIVMHLMGDLHQPLHVGYGSDKGGNTIELSFVGHTSNLHKVWDSEIIRHESITAEDCLSLLKSVVTPPIKKIDVVDWMWRSRAELSSVYSFSNGTIDQAYITKAKPIVEAQLSIAGVRLAYVLNSIF